MEEAFYWPQLLFCCSMLALCVGIELWIGKMLRIDPWKKPFVMPEPDYWAATHDYWLSAWAPCECDGHSMTQFRPQR